jgi:hypothetical protein
MANFRPTIELVSEDARGEIYAINLPGDRELMLLHSNAGTLRGGHSHDVPEDVMVLTGEMKYHKKVYTRGQGVRFMREGSYSHNRSGVNHMGEFLEDSWLIEWKRCKDKNSWKNTNYAPWRTKVQANAI